MELQTRARDIERKREIYIYIEREKEIDEESKEERTEERGGLEIEREIWGL